MPNANVRISGIKLHNLKNVVRGYLSFDNPRKNYKASVVGIYGQNGSGKTTLIDAITLLKFILTGRSVPRNFSDFINVNSEKATLEFYFDVNSSMGLVPVSYEFTISTVEDLSDQNADGLESVRRTVRISNEIIKCPSFEETTLTLGRQGKLIDTNCATGFTPNSKRNLLIGSFDLTDILVMKKLTETTSRSFVFSRELLTAIRNRVNKIGERSIALTYYSSILEKMVSFAHHELFILDTQTAGLINLNAQPILFKYKQPDMGAFGSITLPIDRPTIIPQQEKEVVEKIIGSINIVLCKIIPNMSISIKSLSKQVMQDGSVGEQIQLMSKREGFDKPLPLAIESEGIKKIISVLQLLIVVYNDPSITLAVDELDSGVFEYLLGEILRIISERGKGQLIFTSHNLRVLETIDRGFVAFTTTESKNRYTRMTNIKGNNNLRDVYYRKIMLGDENDKYYDSIPNFEVALALKLAGGYGIG